MRQLKLYSINKNYKTIYRHYTSVTSLQKWNSVVGLEVHAQIHSNSKLFSGASTKFSSPVNQNVSLFDCSTPGTLPVLNKRCVEAGVITALALNCNINPVSMFDRKHYFYADIPAGYQITQQRLPLAIGGNVEFLVYSPGIHKKPYKKQVKLKQIQLEQDSGKSLHDEDKSLVDLNRAGVPLMELVFEPDLKDGEEAAALVKELVSIFHRINTCNCKMEEGALRIDANVSIHKTGECLGVRTEIKNIGSVRGVAGAIKYEIERQIKIKESGGIVTNETRAWNAETKTTVAMRDKEEQQDYRYMPEPNLPPLHIAIGNTNQGCVDAVELQSRIPEMPTGTRSRLINELGLTLEQSIILVNDFALLKIFERTLDKRKLTPKTVANFFINELNTLLNKMELEAKDLTCNFDYIGEILELLDERQINRKTAMYLLEIIIDGNSNSPIEIVKKQKLMQITSESELLTICEKIVFENPKLVRDYKSGKTKLFKAFMGLVQKETQGKADMAKCETILKSILNK